MVSYSAGYNDALDKTTYTEHFDYIFIDENSKEHLISNKDELEILNIDVEITGVEYFVNSSGNYTGVEIKLIGKVVKKQTTITLINITDYINIKAITRLEDIIVEKKKYWEDEECQ